MKILDNNVAEVRYKSGLTQSELGKALGVSKTTINNWEQARYQPCPKMQIKIMKFFDVAREKLFEYDYT